MKPKNFTSIEDLIKKYQSTTTQSTATSYSKESEPVIKKPEVGEIKEVIEHEVNDKEVEPFISLRAETIKLPPDIKKLGVESITTIKFPSYQNIKLPISDEKIITGLQAPVTSSLRWLATLANYLLKKAHLQLKVIHGKVIRIIKS